MDNKVFNVNGRTREQLLATLLLCMTDEYSRVSEAKAWSIDKEKGFILSWLHTEGKTNAFPVPMKPEFIVDMVWAWVQSKEAKLLMSFEGWDANADHDGDNELGFRVYVEGWGRIDGMQYSICAIRPAYMWYGK